MNIAVIFGGESCEHDISIITGVQLIKNINEYLYNIVPIYIDKNGRWLTGKKLCDIDDFSNFLEKLDEVAFVPNSDNLYVKSGKKYKKKFAIDMAILCMHGQRGEDGSVSGILEMSKIPYSSCSMLASSVGMDKIIFKKLLQGMGINCIESISVLKNEYDENEEKVLAEICDFGYPIIIKPSRQGSSIGINICKSIEMLKDCLDNSFMYDERLLIEKFVDVKKEVNIAIFKHKSNLIYSETEEPVYNSEILGFDEKYQKNSEGFESIKRISPAKITKTQEDYIKNTAKKVYDILDMFGVVRFDFIIDKGNEVYLNEVNTIPGSMANYLFKSQLSYEKLIDNMILNGFIRKDKSDK